MEDLGLWGGNQRGRRGRGNGNASRGVMQSGKKVALQDDRAQLYVFPDKTEFEVCDLVVTSATLVCARMTIVFCHDPGAPPSRNKAYSTPKGSYTSHIVIHCIQ